VDSSQVRQLKKTGLEGERLYRTAQNFGKEERRLCKGATVTKKEADKKEEGRLIQVLGPPEGATQRTKKRGKSLERKEERERQTEEEKPDWRERGAIAKKSNEK